MNDFILDVVLFFLLVFGDADFLSLILCVIIIFMIISKAHVYFKLPVLVRTFPLESFILAEELLELEGIKL